jgi:phenylpropionate dioxygenase-like ring-hydroxylating dioxygenase large terminal subunit
MLSKEDNELITRVGPGTVMGTFMRQYWLPGILSTELPGPDSDPLRIRLLGENLIAFRDTQGKVGIVQENCPHRGASLFFGRNEEAGLRCVYHGWKFDVEGNCVDMPNEPAESDFKHKVKAVAYPTRERGGMIWVYMGPRAEPDLPPLPNIEANMLPEGEGAVFMSMRECNWLQGLEGDIDTSHFGFLHAGAIDPDEMPGGTFSKYVTSNRAPHYAVLTRDYGTMYGAYRPAEEDSYYWRIAHFVFPFWTFTPPGPLGAKVSAGCWVPIDDEHVHQIGFSRVAPGLTRVITGNMLPRTSSPYRRFRWAANGENDYLIDRDMQRANRGPDGYTGIKGVLMQDQAVTESMGPIYDRSQEHLATGDAMVIRTRRRLLDAALALANGGTAAPCVDDPDAWLQRSGGVVLPRDADFVAATEDLRKPFVNHPEIDIANLVGPIPAA